MEMTAEPSSQT